MTESEPAPDSEPDDTPTERPDVNQAAEVDQVDQADQAVTATADYRLSPGLIATLVAIPTMAIIGFIAFAALKTAEAAKIPIDSYATSTEAADKCGPLIAALPDTFDGFGGKQVDGNTVRWEPTRGEDSADPVVFRCGVARPDRLAPTSALQVINAAQWFQTESIEGRGQAWVLVDRRPYVAMWVPTGAGNAPLTQVSNLSDDLAPMPLDFGN
ncbi:MAG: DUF3515 domain-containing protein [Gordonia sp. (in: high G+C Gram-positive bacteria)]|uniref:DUF3515 domain-containing protein n=1 Tax=Gordonia sp. (in: high G+C Gram-positive bacteria) TaxID=84139 RepID=UPI003BB65C83